MAEGYLCEFSVMTRKTNYLAPIKMDAVGSQTPRYEEKKPQFPIFPITIASKNHVSRDQRPKQKTLLQKEKNPKKKKKREWME